MFFRYLFIIIAKQLLFGRQASRHFYLHVRGLVARYEFVIIFHMNNLITNYIGWGLFVDLCSDL